MVISRIVLALILLAGLHVLYNGYKALALYFTEGEAGIEVPVVKLSDLLQGENRTLNYQLTAEGKEVLCSPNARLCLTSNECNYFSYRVVEKTGETIGYSKQTVGGDIPLRINTETLEKVKADPGRYFVFKTQAYEQGEVNEGLCSNLSQLSNSEKGLCVFHQCF